jgi:hypothetical protein
MVKRWINNCHSRYKRVVGIGVNVRDAFAMATAREGPSVLSDIKPLKVAVPTRFCAEQGLLSLLPQYETVRKDWMNRRVGTLTRGAIGG